jgi:hypothetical protein
MRIRLSLPAAVAFVTAIVLVSMVRDASAQDLNRRPSVSPYLNLLIPDQFGIPGGNPGQYQTLVEPFIEGRKAAQNNQNQLNRLNAQVNGGGRGAGGGSFGAGGYHSRYMNYSHYYSGLRR